MIIGLHGEAGAGKDIAAGYLVKRGWPKFAFADGVREMALAIDPIVSVDPFRRLSGAVVDLGWDRAKRDVREVRELLEHIGTEGVRDVLGADSWIKALSLKAERAGARKMVISDVRFPNEAEWIRAQGGVVVEITSPKTDGLKRSGHASRKRLPAELVDVISRNSGDASFEQVFLQDLREFIPFFDSILGPEKGLDLSGDFLKKKNSCGRKL